MHSIKNRKKKPGASNNETSDFPSKPDEVVWVKLNTIWWPGQLVKKTEWPDECSAMKKQPIAVVRFFQEDDIL
jgi:hypothetical protein